MGCVNPQIVVIKPKDNVAQQNFTQYIYDLVQDCSISIANALEIPQSCINPSTYDTG